MSTKPSAPSATPSNTASPKLIKGSELCRILGGISRVWRDELVRRGVLPQPVYLCVGARPLWWQHEIDQHLAKLKETHEQTAAANKARMAHMYARRGKAKAQGQAQGQGVSV
jgi:predicted DNA-binding transcriptional regulator AlpA